MAQVVAYRDQIGESMMSAFLYAYSDYDPTLLGFTHASTPAIGRAIRELLEGEDSEEPPPDESGDVLAPPEETFGEWLARMWRWVVEFVRSLI